MRATRLAAGVSPEQLLSLGSDGELVTSPIKGTRPRRRDRAADAALARELELDPKERAELAMVIDVERNDLGRVAVTGSVRLSAPPRVKSYAAVHHRVAGLSARLRPGLGRADLLSAMLPSGSVTGAPKVRAMEVIALLEAQRRGLYTGGIGLVGHDGSLELGMAIRTVTVHGDEAHYFAGGGIVADSDPRSRGPGDPLEGRSAAGTGRPNTREPTQPKTGPKSAGALAVQANPWVSKSSCASVWTRRWTNSCPRGSCRATRRQAPASTSSGPPRVLRGISPPTRHSCGQSPQAGRRTPWPSSSHGGSAKPPRIEQIEVAGPGFLNVTFRPGAFQDVLAEIVRLGPAYGRAPAATGARINVEFVSANPTGPLLVSHGRGAVVGDVVARLLEATGHRVTREYYINDFGNQVRLLGESVRAAAAGEEPPEGGYGGSYVGATASYVRAHRPELLSPGAEEELKRFAIGLMLDGIPGSELQGIRAVLDDMGIEFDVWTSEEGLHRWGRVERSLGELERRGRTTRAADGALFFVTGQEDDKDRVIQKGDGDFTYFASDIAYHDDKLARGFGRMIDVWGADHHGYIARLRSALEALGQAAGGFEVLLFQLVKLVREGREVRMGKRLGNLITLQEVMEEIDLEVGNPHAGRDALRVFFLSRRVDTPITLDLELAKKQEAENPVFYIQYGHARLCSNPAASSRQVRLDRAALLARARRAGDPSPRARALGRSRPLSCGAAGGR